MKALTFLFVFFILAFANLSAQDLVFAINAKDNANRIDSIEARNIVTGETASVEGLDVINPNSFSAGPISAVRDTNKLKRFSFNLYFGLGGRVPLSDSYLIFGMT